MKKKIIYEDREDCCTEKEIAELTRLLVNSPREVLRRLNALKNLQLKTLELESQYYEEMHHLECKYTKLMEPINRERERIINAEYEPTDEECVWKYDDYDEEANAVETVLAPVGNMKGVPEFWLQAFKSTDLIGKMIQPNDEPLLTSLSDIKCVMRDTKPYGYTLEFHFKPNEYFSNTMLTKSYEFILEKDERDPFRYDGPIIYKCEGSKIDWKEKEKDLTMKIIEKKQKHKSTGTIRVVTKEEKQDSFFNFFDTPTPSGVRPSCRHFLSEEERKQIEVIEPSKPMNEEYDEDDEKQFDEEIESLYEADFEIGHFLKGFLIPKAVLYFTGDLVDKADFGDLEENEEDDDDEGED